MTSSTASKAASLPKKPSPKVAAPKQAAIQAPVPAPAAAIAKPAAKPVPKVEKQQSKPSLKAEAAPKEKIRKPKLVRDSFTMPEAEYAVLGEVKKACLKAGIEVKKSELLRVGVALIRQLDTAKLQEILAGLPALKAGRPKKSK